MEPNANWSTPAALAAVFVLGCVLGASAIGTLADPVISALLAEKRSEWLGFWGAIIGAVISATITVVAALYAARSAWHAAQAQIESDRRIARAEIDRIIDITLFYCSRAYISAEATVDAVTTYRARSDHMMISISIDMHLDGFSGKINSGTRTYVENNMESLPRDIFVNTYSFIEYSKEIDNLFDELRERVSAIDLDEYVFRFLVYDMEKNLRRMKDNLDNLRFHHRSLRDQRT